MIVCPQCGTEYPATAASCPSCGAVPPEPVACERCGQEIAAGSDACAACGLAVADFRCDAHPDRTAVARCVLCGRAVCSECASDEKRVTLCPEHRETPIIEGWAQVYSTTSELEAQLISENLRAEGLDAQVYSQRDMMFNLDLGELSIVRVLVPVWHYGSALQVIRSHLDSDGEVAFACAVCGESYEPDAANCSACGAALT